MRRIGARPLAVLVAALVAGCGGTAPSGESSVTATTSPASSTVTSPPPVDASASEVPPSASPSAAGPGIDATWVRPEVGATLSADLLRLAARPTASGVGGVAVTKVEFSASQPDAGSTVLCAANQAGPGNVWECTANLRLRGVRPGTVTLAFSVDAEGVPTVVAPDGTRDVTYAVAPPRPTGTSLTQIEPPDFDHGDDTGSYRVDWTAPTGFADEFLLYRTAECPRPSTRANRGKPCFVAGTPVDSSQLELLASAPGDARSVEASIPESECGGIGGSILLRARNAFGSSRFAIVQAALVIWAAPGEVIC